MPQAICAASIGMVPLPQQGSYKGTVASQGGKNGSPYGLGLGHKLFWPVFFKRQDITFWLTFADKFGSPTAKGSYPNGATPEEQKKLLDALRAISQDAGVIVPEGMLIELLEASRSGSIDTYEKLARYMDEQISEAVLGETLTTNVGQIGSHAASQTHNEVRVELAKADGDLLSDTLNNTLIKWLVDLNRPGAAYPKLWRDFSEPEDLKARAERDQIIYNMGFEPDEAYVTTTYGEGWRKRTSAGTPPTTGPMPAFAEGAAAPAEVADSLAAHMAEAAAPALKGWLERIRGMVEQAESLPALRDQLLAAYGDLPSADLAKVMQLGFAAADLAGRLDVAEESGLTRGAERRSGA